RRFDPRHLLAHHADRTGDLVDALAADAQGHEQAADLRWCRLARHHDVEGFLSLGPAQRLALRGDADQPLQIGIGHHATRFWAAGEAGMRAGSILKPQSCRKFASSLWPCSEAMLSGWNCTPAIFNCRCRRPMMMPSSVSAVISRSAGKP